MGEYYLIHYGVEGQKWGVRRYQNPDGSLTAEGRAHYGYNSSRDFQERNKEIGKRISDAQAKYYESRRETRRQYKTDKLAAKAAAKNRADKKLKIAEAKNKRDRGYEKAEKRYYEEGTKANKEQEKNLQEHSYGAVTRNALAVVGVGALTTAAGYALVSSGEEELGAQLMSFGGMALGTGAYVAYKNAGAKYLADHGLYETDPRQRN